MSDFVGPIEKPDLPMYLDDLKAEMRRIDAYIFAARGKACAPIIVLPTEPEDVAERGVRTGVVASFLDATPLQTPVKQNVTVLPCDSGYYVIFESGAQRSIEAMFRHGGGDAGLRKLWFQTAAMLTRARVLHCRNLFRGVRLRTYASMRPHAALFGETVFSELPQLPTVIGLQKCTDREMDLRLTQTLIDASIQRGMMEYEALQFLISG